MKTQFRGGIPALITPFKDDQFDEAAFAALVERQIAGGVSALVPVGTTGECATLSHAEHFRVVEICIEVAAGRVPTIAGAGSNSTAEALSLVQHAGKSGADAALVVAPYYVKPDQAGLIAHFTALADAGGCPLILYNVPGRTQSDILPQTVNTLAQHDNIVGIKDATSDLKRCMIHVESDDFVQLSGDDPTAIGHRAMGGTGCISVTSNIFPKAISALHAAIDANDWAKAREIDRILAPMHTMLFSTPSPAPAKLILAELGVCEPDVRLPILQPNPTEAATILTSFEAVQAQLAAKGLG